MKRIQNGDFEQPETNQELDTNQQPNTTGSPDPAMTANMLGTLAEDRPDTWRDLRDREISKQN